MAAPDFSVSVLVVDGQLGALHKLGFPLPALASIQEAGALLSEACWNVRKSSAGLSVSLFWPTNPAGAAGVASKSKPHNNISKSKKRRLRRMKCKPEAVKQQPMQVRASASFDVAHHPASPTESVDVPATDLSDITLCQDNPSIIIPESQLSQSSLTDLPAFYREENSTPGVCVNRGDGSFSWSPVKFSRSACKVGDSNYSEDSDLDISECLSIDYQPVDGTPGFTVETKDDVFWAPVAHRTRQRRRVKPHVAL